MNVEILIKLGEKLIPVAVAAAPHVKALIGQLREREASHGDVVMAADVEAKFDLALQTAAEIGAVARQELDKLDA